MKGQTTLFDELVVDNFAGGGGASTGIELALGRPVDIAINHDPDAIAMHKANHPHTEHYCESVWDVDIQKAVHGRPVGLCWFSPDCKHFSKAKGGKPVEKHIRGLAWVAVKWAEQARPRVIILENVEEFKTWGPIDENGYPVKEWSGEEFGRFVSSLRSLGYAVEWKELRACDYGAPTIRKRFFLIARCDGLPIAWPTPTHGKGLKPYRTAADIIDWSIPCKSIFDRKKPLAEATMRRIARGLQKYVINNPKPFIVQFNYDNPPQDVDKPLTTVTAVGKHYLVAPTLVQMGYGDPEGNRSLDLHKPLGTITAGGNKFALVTVFLDKAFSGEKQCGASVDAPLPTVTAVDHNRLVTANFIMSQYGTSTGHTMDRPLATVTAINKSGLVQAFLTRYCGQDARDVVLLNGIEYALIDICMRMLEPHELFAAQGFPKDYIIDRDADGKNYSKAKQIARCGNAVCPPLAEALVRANLPEQCGKSCETMAALIEGMAV